MSSYAAILWHTGVYCSRLSCSFQVPHASLQPVILPRQTAEHCCPITGSDPIAAEHNLQATTTSGRDYCQHKVSTITATEANSGETTDEREDCRLEVSSPAVEVEGNQETSKILRQTCRLEAINPTAPEDWIHDEALIASEGCRQLH